MSQKRQLDAVRSSQRDIYTQRRAQYAALYLLRRIKSDGADDSNYIHTLTYNDLDSESFRDIDAADMQRLRSIVQALERVAEIKSVPQDAMRHALTAEQFDAYIKSFDVDISHIEADYRDEMPGVLYDYAELVKRGDRYTRTANLHRRAVKRDSCGQTASQRFRIKAERCYESAVMLLCNTLESDALRNPLYDPELATQVQQWLDRDVDTRDGFQPDITAEGVPRLRGRKSKYSQDADRAVVGQWLRKHWRQRVALVDAALDLLYDEQRYK